MLSYDLAIFDFDGTLADSRAGIIAAMRHVIATMGLPEIEEEPDWIIGPSIYDIYAKVLQTNDSEIISHGIRVFREHYAINGVHHTHPFPGAREMVEALSTAGKILAIATLKGEPFVLSILDRWGMRNHFARIAATPLDNPQASKEEMIEKILQDYPAIPRRRVLLIGDTASDVEAAHHCGVNSVAVLYGYGNKDALLGARPDYLCDSIYELAAILAP
ncbi:MAG: HAD hydrolase-like protein [Candidatus Sumerlaeota bacterium]|nr:HAD hydrolase-like protein [Candidatus Sumerlaeota bacterium]